MRSFVVFAVLAAAFCALGPPRAATAAKTPAPWKLVWNDEFDVATIDPARWNVATRLNTNFDGGVNFYDPAEVTAAGGALAIRSRPVPA